MQHLRLTVNTRALGLMMTCSIRSIALTIMILAMLASCAAPQLNAEMVDSRNQFFLKLKQICGQRFSGEMTFPLDGQDNFAGKLLVAEFASCSDREIKVPFHVGEDHSRTWIFTLSNNQLQLKHDHRHEDGTPDEINMYGGMASKAGSADSQAFYADQHTIRLIPEAASNIWTLSLEDQDRKLIYHLERHGKPRFTAILIRE